MNIAPTRRLMVVAVAGGCAAVVALGVSRAAGVGPLAAHTSIAYPAAHFTAVPLNLAVFSRPQTADEMQAARSAAVQQALDIVTANDAPLPEEFAPGSSTALRVPLRHLGTGDRYIFVSKTSKGRICAGLTEFTSGCLEGLPPETPVTAISADPDASGSGEPALVWGITRNDVRAVDVLVSGELRQARLAGNAYFFQLADAAASARTIEAVIAHVASGKDVRVEVLHGPPDESHMTTVSGPPEAAG